MTGAQKNFFRKKLDAISEDKLIKKGPLKD